MNFFSRIRDVFAIFLLMSYISIIDGANLYISFKI